MWFGLITLFPEICSALNIGIIGKAIEKNLIEVLSFNPRDYADGKHKSVDDRPYGGGPGMVMRAPPLKAALQAARKSALHPPHVIYLSPQGQKLTQRLAADWSTKPSIILLAGRYEGIDERIIEQEIDEECSIGDYILSGGEFAALVVIDVIARLLPGVVGDKASIQQDSISTGLLKYPQYTRPKLFCGTSTPSVLTQGNHKEISIWRRKQSLGRTWQKRPDLITKYSLTEHDKQLLMEFIEEQPE